MSAPDLTGTPRTAQAWKCCEIHGPASRAVHMAKFAEALEIEVDAAQKAALHAQEHCLAAQGRAFECQAYAERLATLLRTVRAHPACNASDCTVDGKSLGALIDAELEPK
jgi:hypothetical protein